MAFQRKTPQPLSTTTTTTGQLSGVSMKPNEPRKYSTRTRVLAALYYALASALIMMVNKVVLYVWHFPSAAVLALSQFLLSVISLRLLRYFQIISFPDVSVDSVKVVFPLPLLYMGNAISGLTGTGMRQINKE